MVMGKRFASGSMHWRNLLQQRMLRAPIPVPANLLLLTESAAAALIWIRESIHPATLFFDVEIPQAS